MAFSLLIAIAVPLAFLYTIWTLEIYAMTRRDLLILALGWGGIAFGIALAANRLIFSTILDHAQIVLIVAPVVEEMLKGALLVYLAQRLMLRYAVDGAIYGFAIGTGFALVENLFYIANNPHMALGIAAARVISVSLVHAFNSAIIGATLGSNVTQYIQLRVRFGILGLLVAIATHTLFNIAASTLEGAPLILTGAALGLLSAMLIALLIRRALRRERYSISNELYGLLSEGEIEAVTRPNDVMEIIAKYYTALGHDRTAALKEYLQLQAHRAVLSRSIATNKRPEFKQNLQQQLNSVNTQLEDIRHGLGLYTQLWLRFALPSEESDVWALLGDDLGGHDTLIRLIERLNEGQKHLTTQEMNNRRALLRDVSLFHGLGSDEIDDLCLLLQKEAYNLGDVIIAQDAPYDKLYFVLSGSIVESVTDASGQETILNSFSRGDSIGETGMLDAALPSPTQIYVTSAKDTELYTLDRLDFLSLVYAKPQVAVEMLRNLSGYIRHQTELIKWMRQTEFYQSVSFPDPAVQPVKTPVILVVDDNINNITLLGDLLDAFGYKCIVALSGESALAKADKQPLDLILLDIMMPEMNGFEVCNRLKDNPATRDIPIIFLSALNDTENIVRAFELGGVDYITKPIESREAHARIENQLTLSRQREMLKQQKQYLTAMRERDRRLVNSLEDRLNNTD